MKPHMYATPALHTAALALGVLAAQVTAITQPSIPNAHAGALQEPKAGRALLSRVSFVSDKESLL